MDPIHIPALLHQNVDAEARRAQLEQHFAARAEASWERRRRVDRLRQLLNRRSALRPAAQPAV